MIFQCGNPYACVIETLFYYVIKHFNVPRRKVGGQMVGFFVVVLFCCCVYLCVCVCVCVCGYA